MAAKKIVEIYLPANTATICKILSVLSDEHPEAKIECTKNRFTMYEEIEGETQDEAQGDEQQKDGGEASDERNC